MDFLYLLVTLLQEALHSKGKQKSFQRKILKRADIDIEATRKLKFFFRKKGNKNTCDNSLIKSINDNDIQFFTVMVTHVNPNRTSSRVCLLLSRTCALYIVMSQKQGSCQLEILFIIDSPDKALSAPVTQTV